MKVKKTSKQNTPKKSKEIKQKEQKEFKIPQIFDFLYLN